MHEMKNEFLSVTLLDPVADAERMGARYCTGGYIFQVADVHGPMLSGPTYPDSFNWFDGQGIPDSFALSPLRDPGSHGPEALIPGVGVCNTETRTVEEFCSWTVAQVDNAFTYRTRQSRGEFTLQLERSVVLEGRVVRSRTRLSNHGRGQIPVRWFPHPFYPIPDGPDLCALPAPVSVPMNTTYELGASGYLRCADFSARQAVAVACDSSGPLTVLQRHPRGVVAAVFSYAAGHVLVWGNENTFSFEPYLERTVGAGSELKWSVDYHF